MYLYNQHLDKATAEYKEIALSYYVHVVFYWFAAKSSLTLVYITLKMKNDQTYFKNSCGVHIFQHYARKG